MKDLRTAEERGRGLHYLRRRARWRSVSSRVATRGAVGRLARDLMMPLLFRYVVSDKSLAWLYDHRVEWDRRIVVRG